MQWRARAAVVGAVEVVGGGDDLLVEIPAAIALTLSPADGDSVAPAWTWGSRDASRWCWAASRGIGRGIADALAREGGQVAIASRTRETLEAAAAEIEGDVTAFVADTADLERIERLPGEVAEALGPVEILVTNTGGPPPGLALDAELDAWREAYDSLILAPRVLIDATLPGCASAAGGGSSTSARAPPASRSAA